MNSKEQTIERVNMADLGMYLTAIFSVYPDKSIIELAELISLQFNVLCLPEDIYQYEEYYHEHNHQIEVEDYEFESRKQEYLNKLL